MSGLSRKFMKYSSWLKLALGMIKIPYVARRRTYLDVYPASVLPPYVTRPFDVLYLLNQNWLKSRLKPAADARPDVPRQRA